MCMDDTGFEFCEVDESRWRDLATLFDGRGGPKNCWCMVWRKKPAGLRDLDTAGRKAALKGALQACVEQGTPIGILGYHAGVPVAWCSIAPRPTYRPLGGLDNPGDDPDTVWSLVCFFLKRAYRGQGMADALLAAAVAHARQHRAKVIEAYPVDPDSPSYRFMGFIGMFERAGFTRVGRAGTRRHIMRLTLS